MTWKQALSALVAFALGAFVVYNIMSHRPRENPNEEWGIVVVHFGLGPNLWGLFESKAKCLEARPIYMELYAQMERAESPKPGERVIVIDSGGGSKVPVTFSCLSLSDIRGLHLARPSN